MSQWERNAARLASLVFSLSGRGVVWPTSGGPVCVSDGGGGKTKNRQVRRKFIFPRLRWICRTDKFELVSEASRRLRRLCPSVLGCFFGKARGESDPPSAWGNKTRFS